MTVTLLIGMACLVVVSIRAMRPAGPNSGRGEFVLPILPLVSGGLGSYLLLLDILNPSTIYHVDEVPWYWSVAVIESLLHPAVLGLSFSGACGLVPVLTWAVDRWRKRGRNRG